MGSVLKRVPVGTIPESSVLVVASLDICRHVVHNRTRPYCLDLRAGSFSPTIVNNGMTIINRETLHRPGPHPHRSIFTSSKPHAIITHPTIFTSFTMGYFDQYYSTTSELIYGEMFVNYGSGSACQGCYRENVGASDNSSKQLIIS